MKQRTELTQAPLKTCTKCEESKEVSEFRKNKVTKDGLQHWCKDCVNNRKLVLISEAPELTPDTLRELVSYEPSTGLFLWRVNRGGTARAGTVAGSVDSGGYIVINVARRDYKAHRLAWLWMKGEFPKKGIGIDHIDTCRSNNVFSNLRVATPKQNSGNQTVRKNNKLGVKGIFFHECGKFCAQISINGKSTHLGLFNTKELAAAAYAKAANENFGEFARYGTAANDNAALVAAA